MSKESFWTFLRRDKPKKTAPAPDEVDVSRRTLIGGGGAMFAGLIEHIIRI